MISGLSVQSRLMNTPLERYFGNDYVKFSEAAVKLGGIEEEPQLGMNRTRFPGHYLSLKLPVLSIDDVCIPQGS